MKIKGNLKRKVNARHQRHLLTKFDNKLFDDFLDALDRHFGWRFNPANFTIQLDSSAAASGWAGWARNLGAQLTLLQAGGRLCPPNYC